MQPFTLSSFPRAIIHIDADSFFASCEQAVNPELKGKPLITGKERGIASAVSIEAKRLGVKRGMSIYEIKKLCPHIIYVPSDYETYSLFSRRMFAIVRRTTNLVEEYSIDECFAEITGLRRSERKSYEDIALSIKRELESNLGITFSVGLGPSKVVAKLGSKRNKPSGFCAIPGRELHTFLGTIPIEDVWGIGPQTTRYLQNWRIVTALDFTMQPAWWVKEKLTKPHQEIWQELRGECVLPLVTEEKRSYQSISKMKTFTPPSRERAHILSQLSKNVENACIKARRHHLVARSFFFLLRTQEYDHRGFEIVLSRPTAHPNEIMSLITEHIGKVYRPGTLYRATGVVLCNLTGAGALQLDLFGSSQRAEKMARVFEVLDALDVKYGKHTVFLGSSSRALARKQHGGDRGSAARRSRELFKGEGKRKRLGIPLLGNAK